MKTTFEIWIQPQHPCDGVESRLVGAGEGIKWVLRVRPLPYERSSAATQAIEFCPSCGEKLNERAPSAKIIEPGATSAYIAGPKLGSAARDMM